MEKSIYSEDYKLFLSFLKETRKGVSLSQAQLAERLRQTQSFVSKIERGERRIDIVELRAFCRAMNVPFSSFVKQFDQLLAEGKRSMSELAKKSNDYVTAISQSGISIFEPVEIGDPHLWITTPELEYILNENLIGISLIGLAIKSRAKFLRPYVCEALGYPIPKKFTRTKPRFFGQFLDVYIQKSRNLQIWNQAISPIRRYAVVKVGDNNLIEKVKVVTGDALAKLDKTGKLTKKYQARLDVGEKNLELISSQDTANLSPFVTPDSKLSLAGFLPTAQPNVNQLLPINEVFERLKALVGKTFVDAGIDQERNRGAGLHRLVCQALGYDEYLDDGQFPDVRNQLIEVKLQTSPTVDLGLVTPSSTEPLDITQLEGSQIRHCDVRYALFYATTDGKTVTITHFYLTTGESFFNRFQQFQGKVVNAKLQIPLPRNFFKAEAE